MSLFDKGIEILKSTLGVGEDKEKDKSNPSEKEKTGNFIFDYLLEKIGFKEKAEKVKEDSEKERASVFEEFVGTGFKRMFPTLSKWFDLGKNGGEAIGLYERGPEGHALQHEIDSLTSYTLFIPDFLLRYITDLFVESEIFKTVVGIWPGMPEELRQALNDPHYDPDDVISIIRIMNQDVATGKVSYETIIDEGLRGLIPDSLKGIIPANDNNGPASEKAA